MTQVSPRTRPAAPRSDTPRPARGAFCAFLAFLALSSCGGGEERRVAIDEVRERKDAGPPSPEFSPAQRFRMPMPGQQPGGDDPHGAPARRWEWTTPQGWTETGGGQFREMGWKVGAHPDLDASFATARGALLDNVNRWRVQQMALPPTTEAEIPAPDPAKTLLGRPARLVDLAGRYARPPMMGGGAPIEDARMLVLFTDVSGEWAVLKMVGPAAAVAAEQERFLALGASVRAASPGSMAHGGGMPPPETLAAPRKAPFQWTLPEGWSAKASASTMRLATFVSANAPNAECAVSILNGDGGGTRRNLDLWCQQVGRATLSDAEFDALQKAPILGGSATFVSLEGAALAGTASEGPQKGLLGMILERGPYAVFVKMTGPAAEVRGEKDRFRAFCESFRE